MRDSLFLDGNSTLNLRDSLRKYSREQSRRNSKNSSDCSSFATSSHATSSYFSSSVTDENAGFSSSALTSSIPTARGEFFDGENEYKENYYGKLNTHNFIPHRGNSPHRVALRDHTNYSYGGHNHDSHLRNSVQLPINLDKYKILVRKVREDERIGVASGHGKNRGTSQNRGKSRKNRDRGKSRDEKSRGKSREETREKSSREKSRGKTQREKSRGKSIEKQRSRSRKTREQGIKNLEFRIKINCTNLTN